MILLIGWGGGQSDHHSGATWGCHSQGTASEAGGSLTKHRRGSRPRKGWSHRTRQAPLQQADPPKVRDLAVKLVFDSNQQDSASARHERNGLVVYAGEASLFTVRPDGTGKAKIPTPPQPGGPLGFSRGHPTGPISLIYSATHRREDQGVSSRFRQCSVPCRDVVNRVLVGRDDGVISIA